MMTVTCKVIAEACIFNARHRCNCKCMTHVRHTRDDRSLAGYNTGEQSRDGVCLKLNFRAGIERPVVMVGGRSTV